MTEIVILSGKGGTGKTCLSAAFATLEKNLLIADCDVETANLFLILQPINQFEEVFVSGQRAKIDYNKCLSCGLCIENCRFNAISIINQMVTISDFLCDGCMLCSRLCPNNAIQMVISDKSRLYSGRYRNGYMVHARLAPGEENSGKLVNKVREHAKKFAIETCSKTIIIDGPPGTGCPVISSVTGVDKAILVTEPSKSGFNDLKRIYELTESFNVKTSVVINKYNLNPDITHRIEDWCNLFSIPVIGKILFDKQIVDAMLNCKSIIEWRPNSSVAMEIRNIWKIINT